MRTSQSSGKRLDVYTGYSSRQDLLNLLGKRVSNWMFQNDFFDLRLRSIYVRNRILKDKTREILRQELDV